MRDLDRVRDKIEVRLEPRQVVMLAMGTMVFSGLLFAAGFMLGRSRAPVAPTSPLALGAVTREAVEATDGGEAPVRTAAIGEVTFEFPSMLGSRPGREVRSRRPMRLGGDVVSAAREGEAPPADKIERPVVEPTPAPAPEKVEKPAPVEVAKVAPTPVVDEPPALEPIPAPRPEKVVAVDEDDPDAGPPPSRIEPAPVAQVAPAPVAPAPAGEARYTLQVKAARDKAEADAFMAGLRKAGFQPHTVLADIPGKGRFFRIRVGRFGSMAEARAFQRQYKRRSGQPDGGFVTDM